MAQRPRRASQHPLAMPRQTVLVLQGGGALGAYQAGIYRALHEHGMEPDWVVGTSIGAINGALIAGNAPEQRVAALESFWTEMAEDQQRGLWNASEASMVWQQWARFWQQSRIVYGGLPSFFKPRPLAWLSPHTPLGIENASYYDVSPLRELLNAHIDWSLLTHGPQAPMRLTVGAVNAQTGTMRYFDSRDAKLGVDHIMASGALAPAFGAVRIDGQPYWDGGLYSNTPIEVVLDDNPRRDALIFAAQLWAPQGTEPESIWQIEGRLKDIRFASRAASHIERQQQLHRLRHVVRELAQQLPEATRRDPAVRELMAWGCGTVMHIVKLMAPRLPGDDHTKDIDFNSAHIHERMQAGYEDTVDALIKRSWETAETDVLDGIVVHEHQSGFTVHGH